MMRYLQILKTHFANLIKTKLTSRSINNWSVEEGAEQRNNIIWIIDHKYSFIWNRKYFFHILSVKVRFVRIVRDVFREDNSVLFQIFILLLYHDRDCGERSKYCHWISDNTVPHTSHPVTRSQRFLEFYVSTLLQ